MSFTIVEEKQYAFPAKTVFQAAQGAVEGLQGSVTKQDEYKHRKTFSHTALLLYVGRCSVPSYALYSHPLRM